MKILIAEDTDDLRISLKKILESAGYDVRDASNGADALQIACESPPDMIISDILMPKMDGFQFCRKIKENTTLRKIPFIFYTSTYIDEKDKRLAMSLGASRYILKPMKPEEFLHVLNEVITEYKDDKLHVPRMPLEDDVELHLMHDDSLTRKLDKKLKDLEIINTALIQKTNDLEQILYVMSHDLRSPLVNISGYSRELELSLQELTDKLKDMEFPGNVKDGLLDVMEKDIPESLKYIISSTEKMNMLLKGILKISRLGRLEINPSHLDIKRLMDDILLTFEYRRKESGTEIEISGLPACRADRDLLYSVISNMIDNALKFLDPSKKGHIKITGHRETGHAVYCIEDNGIGIAPEHFDKIFQIFFSLEPQKYAGDGLGLSIARKIIEKHNGKIWVESEPGKGSRFYLSLPEA